jgi:glutathione S-transferase
LILIGQFDSPFVRRVGIALRTYRMPFEHRPWSVWRDAEAIAAHNPLRRVPTLVMDDGTSLIDSSAILDALDERADDAVRLAPRSGAERRRCLHVVALATGLGDKAVSLFYETLLHPEPSSRWVERCAGQIEDVFDVLERDRRAHESSWWMGDRMSHADIAVACVMRFAREAHPGRFDHARRPALASHAERCEALPVFQEISQPFGV